MAGFTSVKGLTGVKGVEGIWGEGVRAAGSGAAPGLSEAVFGGAVFVMPVLVVLAFVMPVLAALVFAMPVFAVLAFVMLAFAVSVSVVPRFVIVTFGSAFLAEAVCSGSGSAISPVRLPS